MPSLRSNKNKWSLPPYPPVVETVCIPVTVPNDPRWIGLFLGAIYRLTQQIYYDRDEAKTARLVAAVWQDIYLETVKRIWDCEGGMFDLRVSPVDECSIEKTLDGETWVEVFRLDTDCALTRIIRNPSTGDYGFDVEGVGFYRFPDGPYVPNAPVYSPLPRERSTDETTARCNASYAAALVLQALYDETWSALDRYVTRGAISFAQQLVNFFDVVPAISVPIDLMLEHAEDLYLESSRYIDGGFPSTEIPVVQGILYENSTFVDERVYFNHAGVYADFGALSGAPYDGLAFLLALYVDENMLNAAGNVDVGPGDCSWCVEYDFSTGQLGWGPSVSGGLTYASYVGLSGWTGKYGLAEYNYNELYIQTSAAYTTHISRVEAEVNTTVSGTHVLRVHENGTPVVVNNAIPMTSGFAWYGGDVDVDLNNVRIRVDLARYAAPAESMYIRKVRLYGTGSIPAGGVAC